MHKTIPFLDDQTDFSLVQGGPLFQFLLRAGLVRPSMDLAARRIVVFSLFAWLPLLVLTLLAGRAIGGVGVPFMLDLATHSRFLLAMPLLIAAEVIVHRRIKWVVRQFLDRDIVAPEDISKFESTISSAMRLRNSVVAEVLLLALVILGGPSMDRYIQTETPTWYAELIAGRTQLTAAGYWYVYVSLTILRFLWLRWYFRLFVWYRFLAHVSRRVPLRLNSLHPDRAAGLAFLGGSVLAFAPVLIAHTVMLAGVFGGKIWHEGATLPQFKLEIIAWMVFLMLLVLTPLLFFAGKLADARRTGLREYGVVASRYVDQFRRKWIEGHTADGETLVGTDDIQSLADLSNSFAVVRDMRTVPFGRTTVVRLAIVTALPLLPLVLTMIPLEKLIDRALAVFL